MIPTNNGAVAKEQLVELWGEGGEEASKCRDQASHDRREPRGLAPTEGDGDGRHEQCHRRRHGTHPSCNRILGCSLCRAVHEDAVSHENFLDPRLSLVHHKESLYKFVR